MITKETQKIFEGGESKPHEEQKAKRAFHSEEGFSTAGMVLALLITLSLIFTSAQVYQVNSASATIQNVADAGALAAENVVAEFYILVRICDAIILSLSLTAIVAMGLGLVALCVPATAALSETLIKAGNDLMKARNSFASKSADGLNNLQKLLPFLSAANAEAVMSANSGGSMNASYKGIAILLPFDGEEISIGAIDATEKLGDDLAASEDQIKEAAQKAEEAAQKARGLKERAFMHDCGNAPAYCMQERAGHLSDITGSENPQYRSVDTWSFSVALKRAQAYYPYRLANEAPTDSSVEGQADSALRKRFYAYAIEELSAGFVHEEEAGRFDAFFPLLPKNTSEVRETALYAEQIYPITQNASGDRTMHAWDGCPNVSSQVLSGKGSISQMEASAFAACNLCQFAPSSMGKVAAASSSIENGFEYHYRIVAEAARDYQLAKEEYAPYAEEVKELANGLLEQIKEALSQASSYRIKAYPPGRFGAVALVVNTQETQASQNFPSSFVIGEHTLGAQAALSAATLVSDKPEEGKSVLSSLLDGVAAKTEGVGLFLVDGLLDLWSSILYTYTQGQEAFEEGFANALDSIPYASESGLGTWAASALSTLVESLGLEPAELDAPKPVIVNSAHVLTKDDSSFSQGLMRVKQEYLSLEGSGSGSIFDAFLSEVEARALSSVEEFEGEITISSIELMGEDGPSVPITIALPPSVKSGASGLIHQAIDYLSGIGSSISGVRQWE
ncbi:MAG: molybdenum cofactor biosynthesis enzyme [Raoultibacter sp.]|jgi:hypothetical protein